MCGIAGFWTGPGQSSGESLSASAAAMADRLKHRGPDDSGTWVDPAAGIALAHRRLSVLDLSPEGHQPMSSNSGRYVTVFNGEIYNYRQIRAELEKTAEYKWRGHSDTEVMLAAFETWGVEPAVKRLVGMFAIALWDQHEKVLHLIRDRIGEKPLYYGRVGASFIFASELKAMRVVPSWEGAINRNALALLLRHNCIPAPYTIFEGIQKLLPGTILTIPSHAWKTIMPKPYWSVRDTWERGLREPFAGTDEQAVLKLDHLLRDAVHLQMEADVPLGAFLSGGIDSSMVVALMQAQSTRPVKTFTIGFNEAQYNEANHARAIAHHLGTDHTELYINPSDALEVIPKLPFLYDEPFSDSSQIPTALISQLTRKEVTVSLSGDAGDELFGGYNRYVWCRDIWRRIGWLPVGIRRTIARSLRSFSPKSWDALFDLCSPLMPSVFRQQHPGDKIHKLSEVISVSSQNDMYYGLVSHWKDPTHIVMHSSEPPTRLTDTSCWASTDDFTAHMMFLDLVTYLPDDILVKVDRAAMGVSLETRIPFLDHRVIEFACKIPMGMKIRNGQGKWILRQLLYNYIPKQLVERPKSGFGVPIDSWLRGPLRSWAEALLDEHRLKTEGFFNPVPLRQKWNEHLSGARNWQHHLWDILMFQAWMENSKGTT